jgi:hypothetical protein
MLTTKLFALFPLVVVLDFVASYHQGITFCGGWDEIGQDVHQIALNYYLIEMTWHSISSRGYEL